MTTQEFSIEFDILYNNLASNAAPPLNEYEKSVFLTKAQSDIVLELYSGRNNLGLSYESNEEVRQYLKGLVTFSDLSLNQNDVKNHEEWENHGYTKISFNKAWENEILFTIKEELTEKVTVRDILGNTTDKYKTCPVIPTTFDTIDSVLKNPFKGPKRGKRVLRTEYLGSSITEIDGTEIFHKSGITLYVDGLSDLIDKDYTYREWYLKYPTPIQIQIPNEEENPALPNLLDAKECELPESLHYVILDRAVLYAKQAYIGGQTQA